MEKELISIIVPVYNVSQYISQCLDSLVNQSYKNIEIICVNDGSTDDSLQILKNYQENDSRIKIINQENQGVSQSRNNALKIIQGNYVLFVDSDDYIDVDTCLFAINKMKENKVDVVLWSYAREYANKTLVKDVFREQKLYFDYSEVQKNIYRRIFGLYKEELNRPDHGDSIVTVWGKLYKTSIILEHHIEFISYSEVAAEDALFNMKYFSYVKSAYYEKKYYYHYRKNNSSLTRSFNPELMRQWNNLINYMYQEIDNKKLDDSFKQAVLNRRCLSLIPLGLNAIYKDGNVLKEIELLTNDMEIIHALKKLEIKYLPLVWKVFFISAKYKMNIVLYFLLKVINHRIH